MAPRRRRSAAAAATTTTTTKKTKPTSADDDVSNDDISDAPESEGGQEEGSDAEDVDMQNEGNDGADNLKFSDSLLGRPGRPIPVGTLLKRLQKLSEELKSFDQDVSEAFKEACRPVAKELGDSSILAHKDKGVRAWAAQCIVDLLALCAPDAPFSLQQLRAIFEMFIKTIFPALADPSNAYNLQHIYVLESLANVKSILLITDLPNAGKLMTQLFTTFFDIYSGTAKGSAGGEPVSKHVEYTMLNALVTLVDEADALPQDVIDIVVAQFLRADPRTVPQKEQKSKKGEKVDEKQTTLIRQELPTPYLMAKDICNMVSEKMAREVSKYFSEVIMDASGAGLDSSKRKTGGEAEEAEEGENGLSEEDLNELQKAHRLVRELWRACPAVLQNVVPQLEAELSAENVQLRMLATETLGDLVAGIGAAGPPPDPNMDPAAYPPLSLSRPPEPPAFDPMKTPKAPQPFSQAHPQAYQSFLGRRQDKSLSVRTSWTTAIGRILTTNAGGVGLGSADEKRLVEDLARMLNDADEKVRLAAVQAVGSFNCHDAISKLGSIGGVDKDGSVLANLAAHIKDRKPAVRSECMTVLARLWGVAHGEIAEGNEQVIATIGQAPSHLLNTYYTNSPELFELLDKAIFEELLPINYPPIKSKGKEKANGSSQRVKDSQSNEAPEQDADAIRAERLLLLVNGLDERAKKIFYSICARQATIARYMQLYLSTCEAYNGGVMDDNEDEIKEKLSKVIKVMSEFYPESQRVSTDLQKFAKMHDRRSYQLIKFCIDAKSEYKTVRQAMRELGKRVSDSANPGLMETLTPFLYRVSLMLYNRSHVPAILSFSKSNEKGLSATAHEILKDMSTRNPEVLETHIREMCQSLQEDVPTASKANNPGAVDNLKACAAYARKFPKKLPDERKFLQSLSSYAVYGSPPEVGKHAVSIILAASPRKEASAKDILQKCLKGFKYGEPGFLTRLASLSQVILLAPKEAESSMKNIVDVALNDILKKTRTSAPSSGYNWEAAPDDECAAKMWALKIMVNRIRSHQDAESLPEVAEPVYAALVTLVANEGELSPAKDTPAEYKPQLRLLAANSLLKLGRSQRHDVLLDAIAFVKLSEVAQDVLLPVRESFLHRLRKYLSRNVLSPRFYAIPFLLAYEPDTLKQEMITWLKHRTTYFANQTQAAAVNGRAPVRSKASTTMEACLPRLISLLVHHPDFEDKEESLKEMARYVIFYLKCVATAENISLIYHLAQRVKGYRDAVLETSASAYSESLKTAEAGIDFDKRLYTLSDLASATVRSFVEAHSWNLQTLPGNAKLPRTLFAEIRNDDEKAIAIAGEDFISDKLRDSLDAVVHKALRKRTKLAGGDSRKRKSEAAEAGAGDGSGGDDDEAKAAKRAKRSSTSGRSRGGKKTRPSKRRSGNDWSGDDDDEEGGEDGGGSKSGKQRRSKPSSSAADKDRRKSARSGGAGAVRYAERDDDEDDKEMLGGVAEWEYENGERWREHKTSSEEEDEDDDDDENDEGEEDGESGSEERGSAEVEHEDEDNEAANGEEDVDEDVAMTEEDGGASAAAKTGGGKGRGRGRGGRGAAPKTTSTGTGTSRTGRAGAGAGATGKEGKEKESKEGKESKEVKKALPTRSGRGRATRSAA